MSAGRSGEARAVAVPVAVAVVAAVAVIAALVVVGGPGTARLERYDERRVRDVAELVNALERHRIYSGSLPQTLDAIRAEEPAPPIRDPETGEPYEYRVLEDGRFRVCTRLSVPEAPPPRPGPIRLAESRRVATVVPDAAGRLCWQSDEPRR